MPIPPGAKTVTVTARNLFGDGTARSGALIFEPSATLTDQHTNVIWSGKTKVPLDATGSMSVVLLATDETNVQPTGWVWIVTEVMDNVPTRQYAIAPTSVMGTVDISALAPADPLASNYVLTTNQSIPGPPNVLAVGTVTTGNPGTNAAVTITGTSPSQTVNFTIPRGDPGSGGSGGGTPASTVTDETSYGLPTAVGTSTLYARGDHTHGSPALTTAAPHASAVGDSAAAGTGTTPARSDHVHAREAFGNVTAQTGFGASSSNGTATSVARSDHAHGTPAAQTLSGLGGAPTASPTFTGTVTVSGRVLKGILNLGNSGTGTVTPDGSVNYYRITATGNFTLGNPTSPADGMQMIVEITQDATGGRTITFGTAYGFGTAGTPVLSVTGGKRDYLGFIYNAGASKWDLVAFDPGH